MMQRFPPVRLALALLALLVFVAQAPLEEQDLLRKPVPTFRDHAPEPDGYRMNDYRTPTPQSLKGARTVTTAEAVALWREKKAVFIDVMPQAPRPANLPAGTIWRDRPRLSIPGSAWLPDTGYGAVSGATETYLLDGLARVTQSDQTKPLVIFCLRDCWMSWNAAKRAIAWGYSNVIWYPDGTDGWQEDNLPVEQVKPEPRPD